MCGLERLDARHGIDVAAAQETQHVERILRDVVVAFGVIEPLRHLVHLRDEQGGDAGDAHREAPLI